MLTCPHLGYNEVEYLEALSSDECSLMTNSSEICPTCHQPKEPKTSGRMTQWIAACNCALIQPDVVDQVPTINICANCGKRIERGRSGSFTQWVFRTDTCDCDRPQAVQITGNREQVEVIEDDDPEPLPLSAESFPVDRYKPLLELGGGMAGAVYLCRDLLLNKKVAVKTLRQLNAEQLVSFQAEARSTSKLVHPGIIQVLDFGATESGEPYMVMEYIDGMSLDQLLIQNGALEAGLAKKIVRTLCDALSVAHENGIFHRDIKPSNVLIRSTEGSGLEIKLIDFGLAHMDKDAQKSTLFQGRTVVGTPGYMSPDQVMGSTFDSRAEVYSLGCLLFELLTGRLPFVGETALETLYMHANHKPPRLADVAPDAHFPESLEAIVAKCLEKQPEERYQSTEQLSKTLAPEPLAQAGTMTVKRKDRKWIKALPFAALALVTAGGASLAVYTVLHPQVVMKPPKPVALKQESKEEQAKDTALMTEGLSGFHDTKNEDQNFMGGDGSGKRVADRTRQGLVSENVVISDANWTDDDFDNLIKLKPSTVTMGDLKKITDNGLKKLSKLEAVLAKRPLDKYGQQWYVERLTLDDAKQITPQGMTYLKTFNRCAYFCMRNSDLTDEHLKEISDWNSLQKINISGNRRITMKGINYFANIAAENKRRKTEFPFTIVVEGCQCSAIPQVMIQKLEREKAIRLILEDDGFEFGLIETMGTDVKESLKAEDQEEADEKKRKGGTDGNTEDFGEFEHLF